MPALHAPTLSDAAPGRVLPFPGAGCPSARRGPPDVTADERDELNRLRWFALKSKLAPKPDLERACFLLAGEENVTLERYAIAFFHGLSGKAQRDMVFYRPGANQASDDEIWLLRVLAAWRAGNEAAAAALIAWRVRPEGRRWLRFLSAAFAQAL